MCYLPTNFASRRLRPRTLSETNNKVQINKSLRQMILDLEAHYKRKEL